MRSEHPGPRIGEDPRSQSSPEMSGPVPLVPTSHPAADQQSTVTPPRSPGGLGWSVPQRRLPLRILDRSDSGRSLGLLSPEDQDLPRSTSSGASDRREIREYVAALPHPYRHRLHSAEPMRTGLLPSGHRQGPRRPVAPP